MSQTTSDRQHNGAGIEPAPHAHIGTHPTLAESELEKSFMKAVAVDGLQEVPVELQRLNKDSFSFVGVVSLGVSCINSWVVLVLALGAGLSSGGPTTMVWGFIYATLSTYCTTLSHGEMFAVYPTAGGQYHWAYMVSSPKYRAAVSWFTGMLNVIGLWLSIATAAYLCVNMVVSMILVNNPSFVNTPGIQYGIFVAMTLFGPLSMLCIGNRANRILEYCFMGVSCVGALVIAITLLATQTPKASAAYVFGGVANTTGWDSTVIAWLIGLLQSQYAFIGFDIVYHVSEEIPNVKRDGPRAANAVILFSGITSWILLICVLFCIPDPDRLLSTDLGLPFAQLVLDATGSRAATTIFLAIALVVFSNAARGNTISASRALLAFGRDGMLPYGHLFTVCILGEPVWGIVLSVAVALLVGLVQFGPAAAFNSLLGGSTIALFMAYALPCLCMLLGGRERLNKLFPDRIHNLGRWGVVCNLVAVFFVLQAIVIFSFPAARVGHIYLAEPVTADNMNYVVVFAAFFGVLLTGIWFGYAKKRYQGPHEAFLEGLHVVEEDMD